jgi:biotin-dependent carboxylase-like uncharacterized protein
MGIRVIKPGLATTVQDAGRHGYYYLGIPPSGALDQYSFRAANLLVGNAEDQAVLEITFLGPELEFEEAAYIALAGAEISPCVDGVTYPTYEVIHIRAGSRLTFGFVRSGARAYVAVTGGFAVPAVLGSRSTYGLGSIGGYKGRKLIEGDILSKGVQQGTPAPGRRLPDELIPKFGKEATVRVLPGLYDHLLTEEGMHGFYSNVWRVTSEADRIGYRYRGEQPLPFRERKRPFGAGSDPSNIVDAGYPIGSIQVPGGIEPIILHRDAVSGGGYAMIGTVISADMDLVAQMKPNDCARFEKVNMESALSGRRAYQQRLSRLRRSLS